MLSPSNYWKFNNQEQVIKNKISTLADTFFLLNEYFDSLIVILPLLFLICLFSALFNFYSHFKTPRGVQIEQNTYSRKHTVHQSS